MPRPVEKQGPADGRSAPSRTEVEQDVETLLAAPQSRRLALVVSEEEAAMFRSLADAEGVTVSAWIRAACRKAYKRLLASRSKRAVKRRTR